MVSRKALSFNKDISEQDVVETGNEEGVEKEKVEGRDSSLLDIRERVLHR